MRTLRKDVDAGLGAGRACQEVVVVGAKGTTLEQRPGEEAGSEVEEDGARRLAVAAAPPGHFPQLSPAPVEKTYGLQSLVVVTAAVTEPSATAASLRR